jgi:peptide subunit release factor 1 (eRF1)
MKMNTCIAPRPDTHHRGMNVSDLDIKTLRDFRCSKCGKIYRRYLSYREMAEFRFCECGQELENGLEKQVMSQIKELARRSGYNAFNRG